MSIKEIRMSKGLTQTEASNILGMKLRTYQNYESEKSFRDSFKIKQIENILNSYEKYSEEKGVLSKGQIQKAVGQVCQEHKVNYVVLFGSYAKGKANEKSDVDLLIDCEETGFEFIGLMNDLHDALHKNVDLIKINDLSSNLQFLNEIMKTGERIYG